ncbi:RsmB/NOP family class I SAM-dependent RNA methyltransferase [Flavimaricola marinus]|uniref:Ribosomal RNA small subunit methyltransferase B n=1 Tax=Flavimaricola marinus TaxID=1819565 RepID=A0A238LJ05_9RHOB|nr:RsmB/NOP family class I SAM-dependent RNA methyltransferase [Flavimaricola marinus]SMY09602.1 Ribosomal RNA small subunit methyltransferase B [Flavimaricola marinus]
MTPGARIAAAIEVMDDILAGNRAEKALIAWGRRSRFAGSKDRRAVRDHVYDMLRCQRSFAALGGAYTGRGMAIGALRDAGIAPETIMTGEGHAPAPPTESETAAIPSPAERADLPDWLYDEFLKDWGDEAAGIAEVLRHRAPVFVRVNLARSKPDEVIAMLAADEISCAQAANVKTALKVTDNARKIALSRAYQEGLIELQDASSQAAVLALPLEPNDVVLDYCAGGGGKSLAMAGLAPVQITAHDAFPQRMRDLPARAARAMCDIALKSREELPTSGFDLVFVDAPCSGSGTWRRDPEGKWRMTARDFADITDIQLSVLTEARQFVRPGGHLAYATCSVLRAENDAVVARFLQNNPDFVQSNRMQTTPGPDGDGFFLSVLQQARDAT